MRPILRTSLLLVTLAAAATAANSTKSAKRLTMQRVAELTAPAPEAKVSLIDISGIGKLAIKANSTATLEMIRENRFPIAFDPPRAENGKITPTTPTEFETINAGWTVRLTTKHHGKLIAVYGVADFTEIEFVPGGYGALAGPIHDEKGKVITPNRLDQPKVKTASTRFHIFAEPGHTYEVTLHQGDKAQKHLVKVTTE